MARHCWVCQTQQHLFIINVNIDSIEVEGMQKENCNTNISDAKRSNVKQETHEAKESCTNTDEGLENTNNVNGSNTNTNTLTNYFLSSPNIEIEKRKNYTMCLIMLLWHWVH